MCQNWYSIVGLVLDVIGFLLIAAEWHAMFRMEMRERYLRAREDLEKATAEVFGTEYKGEHANVELELWQEFKDQVSSPEVFRTRRFYPGVFLVILGFIFQLLGSWPHLFRSC